MTDIIQTHKKNKTSGNFSSENFEDWKIGRYGKLKLLVSTMKIAPSIRI